MRPGSDSGEVPHDLYTLLAERWTLLIIRASLTGITRFDDYQRNLGIARNVLSSRLNSLIKMGLLDREPIAPGAARAHYVITEKGEALRPVLEGLENWANTWKF